MKKAARLSSSLLARKGFASPAAAVPMFGKAHHYGQMNHHHIRDVVYDHVDPEQVDLDPDLPAAAEREPAQDLTFAANGEEPSGEGSFVKRIERGLKALRGDDGDAQGATRQEAETKSAASKASKRPVGCCGGAPSKKRVAMTLRLDHPRHLKLRVLSAHINRSSQDILTEALDSFLDQYTHMPDVKQCECLRLEGENG